MRRQEVVVNIVYPSKESCLSDVARATEADAARGGIDQQ
jgi:hypothetical protein